MDIHSFFIFVHLFNKSHTPLYHLLRWCIVKIYSWQLQLSNTPFSPLLLRTTKKIQNNHYPWAYKMKWILGSEWLPKFARWAHLPRCKFPAMVPNKKLSFWPYDISVIDQACLVKMAYMPSWIIKESLGKGTYLTASRTGHQISQIKWTFELFCALVWNLAHFFSKFELSSFIVRFLGHFCLYLVTDKDYYIITIMKANFDSMYFMQEFI